ncbi:hypothetical protein [Enteractinococcus coprophilus]|uniref:WGR domain-containing protein n=1 Tax=Enteractinococcus coprophilus TaxID=1027633 RepID=A0A543AJL6_9MICC|nr:hypothetical protein [Enteractinococcus coprophilus]TQL72783.1 hypothetical protein FB556_1452 [Enteractinococcus coprophilus]
MSIIRMYHTADGASRPTHYREAWWEQETGEFILHHGPVGETGTTTVEQVADESEADSLLASLEQQNLADNYVDVDAVPHETFTVIIKFKGQAPTQVESTNAEKFSVAYSGLLGWRGLGTVDQWETATHEPAFLITVHTVHRNKAIKLAHEALKKTDFRSDRMQIERS